MELIKYMKHIKLFESFIPNLDESEQLLFDSIFDLVVEKYYDDDDDDGDDYLDDADKWLKKYTYEGLDKWPREEIIGYLLSAYSNRSDMVLYRGMNFDTEKDFNNFMQSVKSGKLETGSITSWSRSKSTAWQFAVTRPTYFLNYELMSADSKRKKEREYMLGYRGVVLKTNIKAGEGIDVSRSDFAKEDEVILVPGTYSVEVEEVKPFKDLVKEQEPSEVVLGLTKEDIGKDTFNAQFFNYIVYHGYKLSEKAKAHLYELVKPVGRAIAKAEMQDPLWGDRKRLLVSVGNEGGGGAMYLYSYADLLGPKYASKVKRVADEQLDALIDAVEDSDLDFSGESIGNLDMIMPYLKKYGSPDKLRKYKSLVRGGLAAEYAKLSSDYKTADRVRDINKIKDPNEKRAAIDKYAEDLVNIIKNIQSIG